MQDCKAQPLFGKFCYSSTNFMLLGMALAQATGVPWIACVLRFLYVLGSQACLLSCSHLTQVQADNCTAFNQTAFLPDYLQGKIRFANSGSPKDLNRRVGWARVRMGRTVKIASPMNEGVRRVGIRNASYSDPRMIVKNAAPSPNFIQSEERTV